MHHHGVGGNEHLVVGEVVGRAGRRFAPREDFRHSIGARVGGHMLVDIQ